MSKFRENDPRTRELARKGGRVKAERDRAGREPYAGSILDLMGALGLVGDSWKPWRSILRAVHGLPLDRDDLSFYRAHTGRETPPAGPFAEVWLACGRRAGKSHVAALEAAWRAMAFDPSTLSAGETATVLVLAGDREQARVVFSYVEGIFGHETFRPWLHRDPLRERIELANGVDIRVATASFRRIRGYTVIAAILDEIAFWHADGANPDAEIVGALRPAMLTVEGSLLLALSSPYAARGELHRVHEKSFGRDEDGHALVLNADTRSLNPTVPASYITRAFEDDPVAAASEYGSDGRVQFRTDVEAFLTPAVVRDLVSEGVREIPPEPGVCYTGFVDPSGGSQDSMTLAVAHADGDRAVLDLVREVRPPFSPESVVRDFASDLRRYGISTVVGDRYAGEWPRERFRVHRIEYQPSELTKSDLYRETLPLANSGRLALLDLPVLRSQLLGLERRVSRGGKDSIDHAPGARDDVANAACGALVLAVGAGKPKAVGRVSPPAGRFVRRGFQF